MSSPSLSKPSLLLRPEFAWGLIVFAACAVIAMSVSVEMAFYSLFFAITAWWTWQHEELAFLYFIFLIPLLPMFKMTQTLGTFTLVKDVIIITLFLKVFCWQFFKQTLPYRRQILFLPLFLLGIWSALALLRADSLVLGILRLRDTFLYVLLYVAVLYMPYSKEIMKRRLLWLMTSGVIVMLAGVWQLFFAADSAVLRFDPARKIWIPRMSGTMGHPTVFGEYVTMLGALLAALLIVVKDKRVRLWSMIGSITLWPFIYLTFSRGVWLGYVTTMGTIFCIYCWRTWGKSISWRRLLAWATGLLMAALAVFTLAVMFTPVGTFVRSAFDPTYPSNQIRLAFLNRLISTTTNTEAIIGHGLGDISQKVIQVNNPGVTASDIASGASRDVQLSKDSTLVDNQHLKTFIEMGLIGLLMYFWIYGRLFKHAALATEAGDSDEKKIMGYVVAGFLVGFIIQALFVDIWDVFPTNAYAWILFGILGAYTTKEIQS